jgi:hypothetical protein
MRLWPLSDEHAGAGHLGRTSLKALQHKNIVKQSHAFIESKQFIMICHGIVDMALKFAMVPVALVVIAIQLVHLSSAGQHRQATTPERLQSR